MKELLISVLAFCSISGLMGQPQAEADEIFEHDGIRCKISDTNCLKSDFDGNGISDYSAVKGEGWIYVFMNVGTDSEKVFEIDAGGVAELYAPREKVGERGEPIVKNPSIMVRWVGQNHVVFTWDGKGFKEILFPGFYETR